MSDITVRSGPASYRVGSVAELELLFPDPDERRAVLRQIVDSQSDLSVAGRYRLGVQVARALLEPKSRA